MTKAQQKAAEVRANKIAAYRLQVVKFLGFWQHLINTDAMIAALDAGVSPVQFAAPLVGSQPVMAAVWSLRDDATDHAESEAAAQVERIRTQLEAAGGDLNAVAPRPNSRTDGRTEYLSKQARRATFSRVTKADPARPSRYNDATDFVVMSADGIARFIAAQREEAALQYDMFICKLSGKIGQCDAATLEGNHIWSHSILTVTKGATVERWKTQQILNVSKLGNVFPQWPTRLTK
jgi:hypothetical protein